MELNSLVAILRDGKTLEVFVNGIKACNSITLKHELSPAQLQLATTGGAEGSVLEFESFKVWSLPAASGEAARERERLAVAMATVAPTGRVSHRWLPRYSSLQTSSMTLPSLASVPGVE